MNESEKNYELRKYKGHLIQSYLISLDDKTIIAY